MARRLTLHVQVGLKSFTFVHIINVIAWFIFLFIVGFFVVVVKDEFLGKN